MLLHLGMCDRGETNRSDLRVWIIVYVYPYLTWAHGVVGLSRSLSMREVSGSIPDVSIYAFPKTFWLFSAILMCRVVSPFHAEGHIVSKAGSSNEHAVLSGVHD